MYTPRLAGNFLISNGLSRFFIAMQENAAKISDKNWFGLLASSGNSCCPFCHNEKENMPLWCN